MDIQCCGKRRDKSSSNKAKGKKTGQNNHNTIDEGNSESSTSAREVF